MSASDSEHPPRPLRRRRGAPRVLADSWVVVAAGAAWLGASVPRRLPLTIAALVTVAGLALRRPAVLTIGLLCLASTLAARAWAGTAPMRPSLWSGRVLVATDPEPFAGSVRLVVVLDGHRVEAWARGAAARALRPRLAGERVVLSGEVAPPSERTRHRLAVRHVVGRLTVLDVGPAQPGNAVWRAANGVRRLLDRGAVSLPPARRSLFTGLVLGDDRNQPAELAAAFEAAGLTHLLAVSGQNVAFVLAVMAPGLRRLRLWPRLAATLAALGFFALVTRFEPSVLRAVAMASAAAVSAALGRPASSVRLLALAVAALVLVDPLLVHQVGFQLSVLATAGIVVLAPSLAARLPLPRSIALPLSVTVAAQLATGPLLAARFGPVPLAAIPANLLAEPVAGAAMVYGLAGGLVAGLGAAVIGPPVAAAVHLPTRAMLWWLAGVAHRAAGWPLGRLGVRPLVVLTGVAAWAGGRAHRRRAATVAAMARRSSSRPP